MRSVGILGDGSPSHYYFRNKVAPMTPVCEENAVLGIDALSLEVLLAPPWQ